MRYKINYHSGGNKLKVIDCFTFYNEIKFLQFRLEELYDYVDYFVIVEANKTFSGKDKEFKFEKAINEFGKYMSKIIYIKVEDMPLTSNAWDRETFQRNCILRGLEKISLNSEDIIIIGDLDEVPKVSILNEVRNGNINEIKTLDLDFYYYNLQCKQDRVWKGNVLLPYKLMYQYTPQILRDQRFSFSSISNSGWHLSYFSDETQIVKKIKNFSHQEYNNPEFTNPTEIGEKINKCQDLFKRSDHELTYIPIEKNTNLPNNYRLLIGGSQNIRSYRKEITENSQSSPHFLNELVLNVIKKINKINPVNIIADIGCGNGYHVNLLKNKLQGIKWIGIDFSEASIKTILQKNIYDEVYLSNSEKLPLDDNSVDIAISMENLEHLYEDEIMNALEELKRISKYIIITTPEEESVINKSWLTKEIKEANDDIIPLTEIDFNSMSAAVHKSTISQMSFINSGFNKFDYDNKWNFRSHVWAKSENINLSKIKFRGISKKKIFKITNPTKRYMQLLNDSLNLNTQFG